MVWDKACNNVVPNWKSSLWAFWVYVDLNAWFWSMFSKSLHGNDAAWGAWIVIESFPKLAERNSEFAWCLWWCILRGQAYRNFIQAPQTTSRHQFQEMVLGAAPYGHQLSTLRPVRKLSEASFLELIHNSSFKFLSGRPEDAIIVDSDIDEEDCPVPLNVHMN